MKKAYTLLAVCCFSVGLLIFKFTKQHVFIHGTVYSVSNNLTNIKVKVLYNKDRTDAVEKYLDSCFYPTRIFEGNHEIDKRIVISPDASFDISASSGAVYVKVERKNNSTASVARIREVCEGLKPIILAQ